MPATANVVSEQTVEIGVTGPDDVAVLHVVTGIAQAFLGSFSPASGGFQTQQQTFEAHVGPTLTTSEFRRAVATASLASLEGSGGDATFSRWAVTGVDADFDDDEGRVQLQFDLLATVDAGASSANAIVGGVGFQVMILATSGT